MSPEHLTSSDSELSSSASFFSGSFLGQSSHKTMLTGAADEEEEEDDEEDVVGLRAEADEGWKGRYYERGRGFASGRLRSFRSLS